MTVMRAIHAVPPDPSPTAVSALPDRLTAIRGEGVPDASVVVPVNAQGDLGHVAALLTDLARYRGPRRLEVIVVLNNYAGQEPPHRAQLESWGACLLTIPSVRRSGEAVSFTARIPGARAAASDITIHFDADCRIPDPTTLIDWYVDALGSAGSAYAPVLFHSVPHGRAPELAVAVHHLSRWCKRVLLGIPTLRGSAYAVRRGAPRSGGE